ncbi:MAG TPA: hypothetical protein VFG68_18910 [Fimbriiglobus sp.]|nr:hypothetical protein [Fimbriiglobus sp.]
MVMSAPTIPHEWFRTNAQALLAKTRAGQVNWVKRAETEPRYEVVLPHSTITLSYTSPRVEPDFITLELFNENDLRVGSWSADKPDPDDGTPSPDWVLLNALFDEVHRSVTGWDKVVSDIEQALAKPGRIGTSNGG